MAETGTAIIGVRVVNITDKALIPLSLFDRLKALTAEISEDSELISHSLELRSLVRQIVEEAEVA